ncbi:hypothetical protein BDL97_05G069200 [Sphagnum fallax]|nr:hypothetical protein BDL97_05G069200 [Sphagnum fallax]
MVYHIQMDKNQARVQPYQRGMDLAHSLIQSLHKICCCWQMRVRLGVLGIDARIWRWSTHLISRLPDLRVQFKWIRTMYRSPPHTLQQPSPCKNVPKSGRNKFTKEGKAK